MAWHMLVILLTFFVMGFGDVRGSFVGISKEVFGISAAQGGLIPFFGALSFGLFALPAGLLVGRKGKKFMLMTGLLITVVGHLLPCVLLQRYSHLLAAVFIMGVGMTCLLVSGNPLLREVTGPAQFARNLTFAQFIKSLGSITGPYVLALIVTMGYSWKGIFPTLALFALLAFFAVAAVRIPETIRVQPATIRDIFKLLGFRAIQVKILGIFLFVGSEMGMNTWLATHMWLTHGLGIQVDAIRFGPGLFWIAQGAGRILGSVILNWMEPRRFFLLCTLAGLGGLCGLIFGNRAMAIYSVVLCGLTFSNIWPTLFSLLLEIRPQQSSELSGLTVMANIGGALIPGAMGLITDLSAVRWCFLVPLGAFLYLAALAVAGLGSGPVRGHPGLADLP
jgi:fucose permease